MISDLVASKEAWAKEATEAAAGLEDSTHARKAVQDQADSANREKLRLQSTVETLQTTVDQRNDEVVRQQETLSRLQRDLTQQRDRLATAQSETDKAARERDEAARMAAMTGVDTAVRTNPASCLSCARLALSVVIDSLSSHRLQELRREIAQSSFQRIAELSLANTTLREDNETLRREQEKLELDTARASIPPHPRSLQGRSSGHRSRSAFVALQFCTARVSAAIRLAWSAWLAKVYAR
jgi:chromosome segregation ATPase